jgi:hypothetical protein
VNSPALEIIASQESLASLEEHYEWVPIAKYLDHRFGAVLWLEVEGAAAEQYLEIFARSEDADWEEITSASSDWRMGIPGSWLADLQNVEMSGFAAGGSWRAEGPSREDVCLVTGVAPIAGGDLVDCDGTRVDRTPPWSRDGAFIGRQELSPYVWVKDKAVDSVRV